MREAGTYTDELAEDQLSNIRAFAGIFAAHDGLALCTVPEDFRSTSVRLRYSNSHIAVPVVLNGSTRGDFFFDTGHGGWMMLDDEYAERLDLTYTGEITTITVLGTIVLKAAVLDSIRIGGLTMLNVPVLVCKDYPFGEAGLIGWKVIQRVNTAIDFKQKQIRFSSQDVPGPQWRNIAGGESTTCVPFANLTSLFVIASFGDETPRAYVFDTGCDVSVMHYGDPGGPESARKGTPCIVRIGDLAFDVPWIDYSDFTAIHRKGRYYFPGVIGLNVMSQCVLHIFPKESMLCLEKSGS
jgi:predicted aspartyl protease